MPLPRNAGSRERLRGDPPQDQERVGEEEGMGVPITQIWAGILIPSPSLPNPPRPPHYANEGTTQICIIHALLVCALGRLLDFIKQFCYL